MTAQVQTGQPTIYLLSESALDRLAYNLLLTRELGYQVAVESSLEATDVWRAMRARPQLALLDADTPSPKARDAAQMIPRLSPKTRVLVIGASVDPSLLRGWGGTPICGYVVKDGGPDELRAAIKAVLTCRQYYSAGVRSAIADGRAAATGRDRLSKREAELLPLLARGMTLREAAREMSIGYKTADSYRTNLLRKLGVRDRVELARYAIRERIIDP